MNIKTAFSRIRVNQHNSVFIILAVICLATWIYEPGFLSSDNLFSMLRQASALGVLTVGALFVIVGGGVDLSVAATMGMAIVIYAYGYNNFGTLGLIVGSLLALLFGILMGVINGLIVTKFHVQPFLTTLFTGTILTGLRMIIFGPFSVGKVPDGIRLLGNATTGVVPNSSIIFLAVIIICLVVFNKTVFGRQLIAVGTNRMAAVFSGINADLTIIKSYCVCGLLAVLASMLLAGYTGYASMWIGQGFEFNALVAAVIGGSYLGGGRGSIIGVLGGVLVTTLLLNVVLLFGLPISFQFVVKGAVLIIATLIGAWAVSRRR
jgi:ribose transport system permease protein